MRRSLALLIAVAGAVFALDQWTKHWATRTLEGRGSLSVIGDVVLFTYTRNSGVAFGLGAGSHFPFYIFSVIAVLAILAMFARRRVHGLAHQLALALIFGGALGNLLDRVTTGLVVDFIEIGVGRWRFPVFNVADSAVTVGVVLFALRLGQRADQASVPAPPAPAAEPLAAQDGAREGSDAGAHGAGATRGGAAGPLPGGGAGGSLA